MSELEQISPFETTEANRKAQVISDVCTELTASNLENAAAILKNEYPFVPRKSIGRSYSTLQTLKIFIRDGFLDRYSGLRMVFPGTLRVLSSRMPEAFPFHKNWKTDECHFAYWELFPTIDHLIPVAREGTNNESNLVTTSMARNAAKANFTIEEIGWKLLPGGDVKVWDGQMSWFSFEVAKDPMLLSDPYIRRWQQAARAVSPVINE